MRPQDERVVDCVSHFAFFGRGAQVCHMFRECSGVMTYIVLRNYPPGSAVGHTMRAIVQWKGGRPKFVRAEPTLGRRRRELARTRRPISTQFEPLSKKFESMSQTGPSLGHARPSSGQLLPNSANFAPRLARGGPIRPTWTNLGPISAALWAVPILVNLRLTLVDVDEAWADAD